MSCREFVTPNGKNKKRRPSSLSRNSMLSIDWQTSELLYHWPESSRLKNCMENQKARICYTMPGIKSAELLSSDVSSNVMAFYDEHFSKVDVRVNEEGISKLVKQGYFEQALNATTALLNLHGQGLNKEGKSSQNTETSLALWALRFQLLMMLKQTQQAIDEMSTFEDLDAPDLYFQYYSGSQRKGTMVPFSMRLIHAEILRFSPIPWKAMTRLQELKQNVEWVISDVQANASKEILDCWKARLLTVEKITARTLFSLGEYEQAMDVLNQAKSEQTAEVKADINRTQCRMAMSVGDQEGVNKYLTDAATVPNNNFLLHKALRTIFIGAYPSAAEYLQRLAKVNDTRPVVANLQAISMLYTGKVHDGVKELSKSKGPLPENVMTNIKAMSELGLPAAQKETLLNDLKRKNQNRNPV